MLSRLFRTLVEWVRRFIFRIPSLRDWQLSTDIVWLKHEAAVKVRYDVSRVVARPPLFLWIHEYGDFNAFIDWAFVEKPQGEYVFDIGLGNVPDGRQFVITFVTLDWVQASGSPSLRFETPHLPAARA